MKRTCHYFPQGFACRSMRGSPTVPEAGRASFPQKLSSGAQRGDGRTLITLLPHHVSAKFTKLAERLHYTSLSRRSQTSSSFSLPKWSVCMKFKWALKNRVSEKQKDFSGEKKNLYILLPFLNKNLLKGSYLRLSFLNLIHSMVVDETFSRLLMVFENNLILNARKHHGFFLHKSTKARWAARHRRHPSVYWILRFFFQPKLLLEKKLPTISKVCTSFEV